MTNQETIAVITAKKCLPCLSRGRCDVPCNAILTDAIKAGLGEMRCAELVEIWQQKEAR